MTTNGVGNSPSNPETLPPKKRNSRENLNEAPTEPVFKTPSVFWNQSGFKRTRRSREPATTSLIDLHSAVAYYPQWPDVRQTFPHPLWDGRSYPSPGHHVAGGRHILPLSNFNKSYPITVHDFYQTPPYWGYVPAESRDVYVKNYGNITNLNGSKIVKPVPRSFVPLYTTEATRPEMGRAFDREGRGSSSKDVGMEIKKTRMDIPCTVFNPDIKDPSQTGPERTENLQHQQLTGTESITRNYRPLVVSRGSAETQQQLGSPQVLSCFVEGSLIELEGGRLKRVENLKMEDFECCAESCQEFRLKKFTVQKISQPRTPGLACLEVEVEEDHSKISLEVCAEYPFFVCTRGWSSCSPERTAQLCNLRCHRLHPGDVCLALAPVLVAPGTGAGRTTPPDQKNGTEQVPKVSRPGRTWKRHNSAPELTNAL